MQISIFWHRRDLRLEDNAGLYHALKSGKPVLPLFIFDKEILEKLEDKNDARVSFIYESLQKMKTQLEGEGSGLIVRYGKPIDVWKTLVKEFKITSVYSNKDYEPYAQERDEEVKVFLETQNISFHTYKDQVIFEGSEVTKDDGLPYTVFTPYSRKWKAKLNSKIIAPNSKNKLKVPTSYYFQSYPNTQYFKHFKKTKSLPLLSLKDIGFEPGVLEIPGKEVSQKLIKNYSDTRNFPAIDGTSKLGIHFRFGTISIREKARKSQNLSEVYLNELIWRDFYSMILSHFPHVVKGPFRAKYDWVEWRNNEAEFKLWCEGKTGYPIVDAGMRELNQTGHMHNRVRMIVASFLTKHLLIDWKWGEAYFARNC